MTETQWKALTGAQVRQRVEDATVKNLHEKDVENTTRGHCAGFLREGMEDATEKRLSHPRGLDAHDAYEWYKARGAAVDLKDGTLPGYLLFKFRRPSLPHGHCGVRIKGNRVAENSTLHALDDEDARGIRTLSEFGRIDGAVDPARIRR